MIESPFPCDARLYPGLCACAIWVGECSQPAASWQEQTPLLQTDSRALASALQRHRLRTHRVRFGSVRSVRATAAATLMAAGDRRWSRWAAALLLLLLAALQACARPTGGASGVSPASGTVGSGGILFVSLSLRGHLVPLTRLASALVDRGYQRVAFAVQEDGREYVNKTDAKFISLGRLPYAKAERRERLKQVGHGDGRAAATATG